VDPTGLYLCLPYHWNMTFEAARQVGFSWWDARRLANQVCDVDKGTQGPDLESAHTHAMSGRKDGGRQESCQHAYEGTKRQIERDIDSGVLAKALHTIEDATATAHRGYQPWIGGYGPLHLPDPAHVALDFY